MSFAAPIWLLALLPWSVLTAWLLLGRHQRQAVPFLPLWQSPPNRPPRTTTRLQPPPLPILLFLLSLLLSLLAAAGLRAAQPAGLRVTVILDRGLTMSAGRDRPRFLSAAERAAASIPNSAQIDLIDPIDATRQTLTGADWLDAVRHSPRTALDTTERIRDAAAQSPGPALALTDHPLNPHPGLTLISPTGTLNDVGILALAARDRPSAQVMVTLRSHRPAPLPVTLRITTGPATATRRVDLPAAGDVNVFIDLPSLADTIKAELVDLTDDLPANDAAWLVRSAESPRLELRSAALPEPVRHFAEVYARTRPPTAGSPPLALAADPSELSGGPGAAIPPAPAAPAANLRVTADPLTSIVDWTSATLHAPLAPDAPPGDGWTPLVSAGDRPLVARRESPARQIWVGFDQTAWSRSPDFIVFWANAMHWLAGNEPQWTSNPARLLPPEWKPLTPIPPGAEPNAWPGLYRDDQGRPLAMNAAPIPFDHLGSTAPGKPHLSATNAHTWSRPLLLAAMLCALTAALAWRRA